MDDFASSGSSNCSSEHSFITLANSPSKKTNPFIDDSKTPDFNYYLSLALLRNSTQIKPFLGPDHYTLRNEPADIRYKPNNLNNPNRKLHRLSRGRLNFARFFINRTKLQNRFYPRKVKQQGVNKYQIDNMADPPVDRYSPNSINLPDKVTTFEKNQDSSTEPVITADSGNIYPDNDGRTKSPLSPATVPAGGEVPASHKGSSSIGSTWKQRMMSRQSLAEKELVDNMSNTKQNWRGILISLIVIIVVCLLILFAIILMTPRNTENRFKEPLTFSDFITLEKGQRHNHYIWISDYEFAYHDEILGIQVYDVRDRKYHTFVNHDALKSFEVSGFDFSKDLKYIIIEHERQGIYRHSYLAKYHIYDREDGQFNALGPNFPNQGIEEAKLSCVTWSQQGHKLVFVHENNIYYLADLITTPIKITHTPPGEKVHNGVPDWLYEEEILMSPCAIYWSRKSDLFAYVQINFTEVPVQPIIEYGEADLIYPRVRHVPYPKVGQINPSFAIYVVDPLEPFKHMELNFTALTKHQKYKRTTTSNEILNDTLLSTIFKSSVETNYTFTRDDNKNSNNNLTLEPEDNLNNKGNATETGEVLDGNLDNSSGHGDRVSKPLLPIPIETQNYFTDLLWASEDTLIIEIMDRKQITGYLVLCKLPQAQCIPVLTRKSADLMVPISQSSSSSSKGSVTGTETGNVAAGWIDNDDFMIEDYGEIVSHRGTSHMNILKNTHIEITGGANSKHFSFSPAAGSVSWGGLPSKIRSLDPITLPAPPSLASFPSLSPSPPPIKLFIILPRLKHIEEDSFHPIGVAGNQRVALKDYTNQIARITINGKSQLRRQAKVEFLTNEPYNVDELYGYDKVHGYLYFRAAPNDKTGARHLYRLVIPSSDSHNTAAAADKRKTISECLTCNGSPEGFDNFCEWYVPLFNTALNRGLWWCLGPGIPDLNLVEISSVVESSPTSLSSLESSFDEYFSGTKQPLRETSLAARKIVKKIATIYNNSFTKNFLATRALPTITFMDLQIPFNNNYTVPAKLILPPSFKVDNSHTYPMLVEMYGGPQSQNVDLQNDLTWNTFICGYYNVVIAKIDARGTGYRGRRYMTEIYHHLGEKESLDHINAIKQILFRVPAIDPKNIAIWGWSFGGYLTSMILARSESLGLVKCGIAVAPVSDWRYYDSAYTEKYMGLLAENHVGYDASAVHNKVENFKSHKYLLIHGLADDNVHFQHAAQLIKALTKKNILFDLMVYPDETHDLLSVREHLYAKMTDFLIENCFRRDFPPHTEIIRQMELLSEHLQYQQQQSLNEKITDSND